MSALDSQIIYTEEGPQILVAGHGLDRAEPQMLHDIEWGVDQGELTVEEVCFGYAPRVKWCSKYTGFGCDEEGDWHPHWYEVRRNENAPESFYTLIGHKYPARSAATS